MFRRQCLFRVVKRQFKRRSTEAKFLLQTTAEINTFSTDRTPFRALIHWHFAIQLSRYNFVHFPAVDHSRKAKIWQKFTHSVKCVHFRSQWPTGKRTKTGRSELTFRTRCQTRKTGIKLGELENFEKRDWRDPRGRFFYARRRTTHGA